MAKKSTTPRQGRHPEKKIGPFAGGIGVAIWLNTVDTDDGPKQFSSPSPHADIRSSDDMRRVATRTLTTKLSTNEVRKVVSAVTFRRSSDPRL